jgi:FtsP/CotA-like multicopper oxidase with cupredoxin domain
MSKRRKKSKSKNQGSGITRRDILKLGSAAGAATVLGPMVLTSKKSTPFSVLAQTPPAEPVLCGATPPAASPPTRPFVDNLPVPFPAIPTILNPAPKEQANIAQGEAPRAAHQRWAQFLPDVQYLLDARAATHRFHADYQPSYIWGFNGRYPAPTVLNAYGHPTLVRFRNSLPKVTTSFGRNEITVHLHNGHTASESDGFAGDFYGPGLFKDNHYANAYAGIDAFGGNGDPREAMHTFWFHDHRAAFTANNNYLGLNGMYIAYDQKDPGHEFATSGSLRLPGYYGFTDFPLILTDKKFCPTANGRTEAFQVVGGLAPIGDKWIVNGKIQPKLSVTRRKYRFRILNTGPAKTWNLSVIKPDGTNAAMTVIATDANFLASPVDVTTLPIEVATRYDVIINFAQFPVGSKVYLREAAPQSVGQPAPEQLPPNLLIENVVMRFDVVANAIIPDTPPIPATLTTYPTPFVPTAKFRWVFTLVNGRFLINGLEFDPNRVDHVVLKGSTEEWILDNAVGNIVNWTHPVHIHFEEGMIQKRELRISTPPAPDVFQNVALTPLETGRKDVYNLPPNHRVTLRMRFRDFVGRYLIHCHNMNHEDTFMMARWDIVDSLTEYQRKKEEIAQRRREAGLPVAPETEVAG